MAAVEHRHAEMDSGLPHQALMPKQKPDPESQRLTRNEERRLDRFHGSEFDDAEKFHLGKRAAKLLAFVCVKSGGMWRFEL